jgi:hypothetical protein
MLNQAMQGTLETTFGSAFYISARAPDGQAVKQQSGSA